MKFFSGVYTNIVISAVFVISSHIVNASDDEARISKLTSALIQVAQREMFSGTSVQLLTRDEQTGVAIAQQNLPVILGFSARPVASAFVQLKKP